MTTDNVADEPANRRGPAKLPLKENDWNAVRLRLEGDVAVLELLLLDGINVDVRDAEGRTLLHRAAQRGHLDAVELLIRHDADINAVDASGKTPLQRAEGEGHRDVAALLRQHGALTSPQP
jgi:ankyrin repeat protein